jgi:arylsulfatase A-like enzyme
LLFADGTCPINGGLQRLPEEPVPGEISNPDTIGVLRGNSMLNRRKFIEASTAGLAATATSALAPAASGTKKPNIIVILADDMGFSDIGCYGSEIATPHLDALAKAGVRSTHFRNTARCCPTRAALLTGLYSHQAGVGHMVSDYGVPGYRGDLSRNAVTIAEALKPASYNTAMIGKWHVTSDSPDVRHNWPRKRGFDYAYSTIVGANNYFNPHRLIRNDEYIQPTGDYYYTEALSREAAGYIGKQKGAANPFFMYLAYTAPHWPLHAREEDIQKYAGRYAGGWDKLRAERYQRMQAAGAVDQKWGIAPRDPDIPAWDSVPNKEQ